MEYKIELPLVPTVIDSLRIFDTVRLSGTLLVARDQAHKRLTRMILAHEALPVDLACQLIYYMG
ncbi:MAG: fumarate hydratase C-terminal domain-containing protein, partial [Sphaerochaetaceae bacterium]